MERARRGEPEAQRALVERYQRPVFALLHRYRGPSAEVEDLAQETFLRVFRELPSFRPRGRARLSTWILTIATRLAIDAQRRADVRSRHEPDPPAAVVSPERLVERKSAAAAVAAAVSDLPEPFRAALVLRVYHDRSYREIADAMECDVGTAKSRVSRARRRLREALGEGMA
ncbi:MAG TPA: sigma-70 family RNA polymerase sigma factor [Sandaracinaceae bacterium LLY-WYZ-13_1]|nr:sigma-70 family RNA polymerase sigma factor [Sandaracinaceae bacterium LLY-WYZ-13_1]